MRVPITTLTDKELASVKNRVIEKYGYFSPQREAIDKEIDRRRPPSPVLEEIEIAIEKGEL